MSYITLTTPKTKTTVIEYDRFIIKDVKIILSSSAKIIVLLIPTTVSAKVGAVIKTYTLEGTDYTDWGNDDTYLINYLKDAINSDSL
jgi:hypothetical protein